MVAIIGHQEVPQWKKEAVEEFVKSVVVNGFIPHNFKKLTFVEEKLNRPQVRHMLVCGPNGYIYGTFFVNSPNPDPQFKAWSNRSQTYCLIREISNVQSEIVAKRFFMLDKLVPLYHKL